MIRTIHLILVLLVLQACATTNSSPPKKLSDVYAPSSNEQFVFIEKNEGLQKYGYDNFCKNTETFACRNRLDYADYVGTSGYFKTTEPAYTDFSGYDFWPVKLENGKDLFYVSNEKYGGKYGSIAPIMPKSLKEKINSFQSRPLVDGSDLMITGRSYNYGKEGYLLSDGRMTSKEKVEQITKIAAMFPESGPQIAEALLDFDIKYDQVENRYFFIPTRIGGLSNEAKLYVGMQEERVWLRMEVQYYGDDWLFVKAFKVAADDFRWQSPTYNFKREHSSGSVWEWIDKAPNNEELAAMKALTTAQSPIIRFQGRDYYKDFELSSKQKDNNNKALELFDLLKK